jgi:penicillin-binding protein 2
LSYGSFWETDDRPVVRRPWPLTAFLVVMVLILALRLYYIQVMQYDNYLSQAADIRIKYEEIDAPRGFIYDRTGVVLAENQPSYSVTVDPLQREHLRESITTLERLVPGVTSHLGPNADAAADSAFNLTRKTINPVRIIRDADFRLISIIEENKPDLPGIGVVFGQRRHYPYGAHAAHVLGYTGEITREELAVLGDAGYKPGHSIGRVGLENKYEDHLRGTNGAKFVEMNYLSRRLGIADEVEPISPVKGEDVQLTLDIRLQLVAEEAFGDSVLGSIVAMDPRNGEVLVLASLPTYDLNQFTHVITAERLRELGNDPDKPQFNRALRAVYSPGSPFKVLTALAGLANGVSADTRFNPCNGTYFYGRYYRCWYEQGHGSLDMVGALENSCNVYMYQLIRRLSLEQWHSVGASLGLGQRTGIDLLNESPGILPDMHYYDTVHAEGFSPGMMLNLSIGQGEIVVTPIQLARYTAIIASDGLFTTPHLMRTDTGPVERMTEISPESFAVVKEGMRRVIHGERGTARSAKIPNAVIAGKTGTVQNPHGADHKIFVAFAPFENPEIVVACVAENVGDYPSSLAVPIVRKVLMEYFRLYHSDDLAVQDGP